MPEGVSDPKVVIDTKVFVSGVFFSVVDRYLE